MLEFRDEREERDVGLNSNSFGKSVRVLALVGAIVRVLIIVMVIVRVRVIAIVRVRLRVVIPSTGAWQREGCKLMQGHGKEKGK